MNNRADYFRLIALQRPVKHYYGMLERDYRAIPTKTEHFFVGGNASQAGKLPIVRNSFNVCKFFP